MELGKHTKALLSEVKMIVTVVNNRIDKKHVLDIRRSVFVNEQKVTINEEIDAYDESETVIHLLGKHENTPVAASRIRFVDDYAKLERIAVLKNFRGKNFGADMVISMEKVILTQNCNHAVLNAQVYAEVFYKKLGYTKISDVFMDAGIPHITMDKKLK